MKRCPACNAECFDDMDTCYECLYSFVHSHSSEKTPIEQMQEAASNSQMLEIPKSNILENNNQAEKQKSNSFSYTFGSQDQNIPSSFKQSSESSHNFEQDRNSASAPNFIQPEKSEPSCELISVNEGFVCPSNESKCNNNYENKVSAIENDNEYCIDGSATREGNTNNTNNASNTATSTEEGNTTAPSMQTWVLKLGVPADCDGVTVRLERA